MRNITFDYSKDGGSTFTGTATLACNVVRCTLMPSQESDATDAPTMTSAADKCQIKTARLHVDIQVSSKDLNPRDASGGTTNFLNLQKWCCAPIMRIYNASVATRATLDGWNQFDTSSNTNYVNLRDDPQYEFVDMDAESDTGNKLRKVVLHLETRQAITI